MDASEMRTAPPGSSDMAKLLARDAAQTKGLLLTLTQTWVEVPFSLQSGAVFPLIRITQY